LLEILNPACQELDQDKYGGTMKKEEFPTFLNEQPTVVFGRTARELLVIACGLVGGYVVWIRVGNFIPGPLGFTLGIMLAVIIVVSAFVVALVSIASRPLEEWFFCWLAFVMMPKLHLYRPLEEDVYSFVGGEEVAGEQNDSDEIVDIEED
jgi:hypothetical protein